MHVRKLLPALLALLAGIAISLTSATPANAATPQKWVSVSSGSAHTCAVAANHSLYCWGGNFNAQLGLDDSTNRNTPTRVGASTSWASVSTGSTHTCGIRTSGSLYCWGDNSLGQLGVGDTIATHGTPTRVGTSSSWAGVSAGAFFTCARAKT